MAFSEPARLAAIAATQTAKTAALQSTSLSPSKKGKSSNSVRRGDRMGEVIVDGVVFEFDESGSKLVKKDPQPTADENENSKKDTPLRTSVDGQKYIRTKTGNLISKELLEKRRESRKNQDRVKRLGEMGKDIASHQRIRDGGRKKEEIKAVRKSGLCSFYNKTGREQYDRRGEYFVRIVNCSSTLQVNASVDYLALTHMILPR